VPIANAVAVDAVSPNKAIFAIVEAAPKNVGELVNVPVH
jgi:hypothetical protein